MNIYYIKIIGDIVMIIILLYALVWLIRFQKQREKDYDEWLKLLDKWKEEIEKTKKKYQGDVNDSD